MRRLVVAATALLFVSSAYARTTMTYVCKDGARSYPLKVDEQGNALVWKGNIYKITTRESGCKASWHAERSGSDSFDVCAATQGYAEFKQNGRLIQCEMKR